MYKRLILIGLLSFTTLGFGAKKPVLYQIDVIAFRDPKLALLKEEDLGSEPPPAAIVLEKNVGKTVKPYHILPQALSSLEKEHWNLTHKSPYKVLFNYSFRQPLNSKESIQFPNICRDGYTVEGTFKVQHKTFYSLNTDLIFYANDASFSSVRIKHNQELKPGIVYYLDNPRIGMIVKIHKVR